MLKSLQRYNKKTECANICHLFVSFMCIFLELLAKCCRFVILLYIIYTYIYKVYALAREIDILKRYFPYYMGFNP